VFRVITLNVNGIRAAAGKGLWRWVQRVRPDVLCLQEVKAHETDIPAPLRDPEGLHAYFCCARKKGYAGTALYARRKPRAARFGFGVVEFDDEGRYLEAQFGNLTVVSLYAPSGSAGPHRQASKFRFMEAFLPHLAQLRASGRGLRRRAPPARRTARAVHVVEQPRRGVGQERGLAHRLPDRHAWRGLPGAVRAHLQAHALFRPCAARRRLRRAAIEARRMQPRAPTSARQAAAEAICYTRYQAVLVAALVGPGNSGD